MVRNWLSVVLCCLLALVVACDDKKPADEPEKIEAAKTDEAKPEKAVAEKAEPAEAKKEKAPEYSAETAAKLMTDLEKCEYDFSCDAYKPLVSFGKKVSADLAAFAADASKPAKARQVAAKALSEIGDPATGMKLLEAAKAEKDFILRDKLFEAAGASGSEEVFADLKVYYLDKKGKEHKMQTRAGLRKFGKQALTWALEQLPKHKKQQVQLADIVTDLAEKDSLEAVKEVMPKVKDIMARHRLASKAFELGDKEQLSVLVKGLKSKNKYDRSDAANFLARVVKDVPQEKKDELIELLKAGKKKDPGGLTAVGYDKCLKVLEAK